MSSGKKVLIVDDDEIIANAYSMILQSMGHEVAIARDGQEGLQKASLFKPDLIMLDVLMPVLDGLGFLQKFNPALHPETKVLILSNSAAAEKLEQAINLGAKKYLIKTELKPEQLKAEIAHALA